MIELPVSAIAAFSANGRVHRAFNHLIAAAPGTLLCVPLVLAAGDLRGVVDGCPVPWEEVWAVLDQPPAGPIAVTQDLIAHSWPPLAAVLPPGWELDFVPLGRAPRPVCSRLTHPCGVRFAQV